MSGGAVFNVHSFSSSDEALHISQSRVISTYMPPLVGDLGSEQLVEADLNLKRKEHVRFGFPTSDLKQRERISSNLSSTSSNTPSHSPLHRSSRLFCPDLPDSQILINLILPVHNN